MHLAFSLNLPFGRAALRTCARLPGARVLSQPAAFRWSPRSRRGQLQVRMVLTESADLKIGEAAPPFSLPEPLTGKTWTLEDLKGKPLLVMFICNHCPYVVMLKRSIVELTKEYSAKGMGIVAISSNSAQTHPQDGPDKMAQEATELGLTIPYLYDGTQEVAKAYKAACTPEFYVFTKDLGLAYHGQYDDSRPRSDKPVTGKDLRAALDAVLAGGPAPASRPSIGCNIKWHPGNEPDYFGEQIVKK